MEFRQSFAAGNTRRSFPLRSEEVLPDKHHHRFYNCAEVQMHFLCQDATARLRRESGASRGTLRGLLALTQGRGARNAIKEALSISKKGTFFSIFPPIKKTPTRNTSWGIFQIGGA